MDSLQTLLDTPAGRNSFKDFLRGEFSVENLLLYLEVAEFRGLVREARELQATTGPSALDEAAMRQTLLDLNCRAQDIYDKYVSTRADLQVNLPALVRLPLQQLFETSMLDDTMSESFGVNALHGHTNQCSLAALEVCFDGAQCCALRLMETDSWRRYQRTEGYEKLREDARLNSVRRKVVSVLYASNGPRRTGTTRESSISFDLEDSLHLTLERINTPKRTPRLNAGSSGTFATPSSRGSPRNSFYGGSVTPNTAGSRDSSYYKSRPIYTDAAHRPLALGLPAARPGLEKDSFPAHVSRQPQLLQGALGGGAAVGMSPREAFMVRSIPESDEDEASAVLGIGAAVAIAGVDSVTDTEDADAPSITEKSAKADGANEPVPRLLDLQELKTLPPATTQGATAAAQPSAQDEFSV